MRDGVPRFLPLTFISSCSGTALCAGSGAPGQFLPGQSSEQVLTLAYNSGELRAGHAALPN